MSDYATVARPYARAAFAYAEEHNRTDEWFEFLSMLNQVTVMSDVLSSANCFTDEYKLDFLRKILDGHLDKNQENFIKLLLEYKRIEAVADIFEQYQEMYDELKKLGKAEVVSARKLSSADLDKVNNRLETKYDKKFEVVNTVDPSIIGGLILKIDDKVIDESISGKLGKLSSSLLS